MSLLIRMTLCLFLCAAASLAVAKPPIPVTLEFSIRDARTSAPLNDVTVTLFRDFPDLTIGVDEISRNSLKPFSFFKILTMRSSDQTTKTRLVGSWMIDPKPTSTGVACELPFESVVGAENLWVELKREGYHTSLRSLWVGVPPPSQGLSIGRRMQMAPIVNKLTDSDTTQTISEYHCEIIVPPGAIPSGQTVNIDVQPFASGMQYLSLFPLMHTYPIAVSPASISFNKPLTVRYTPAMFKGVQQALILWLGVISETDYSLKRLERVWPNDKKSARPPFTYQTTISKGGVYVLVD